MSTEPSDRPVDQGGATTPDDGDRHTRDEHGEPAPVPADRGSDGGEAGPVGTGGGAAAPGADDAAVAPALVDWGLAGRRLIWSGAVLLALAVGAWIVTSLVAGSWQAGVLGNFVGLALAGVFLVEIWVVGGSALRGMLHAGEAGHRLAGSDVGLLPPQLRRGGSMKVPLAAAFAEQAAEEEAAERAAAGEHTAQTGGSEPADPTTAAPDATPVGQHNPARDDAPAPDPRNRGISPGGPRE